MVGMAGLVPATPFSALYADLSGMPGMNPARRSSVFSNRHARAIISRHAFELLDALAVIAAAPLQPFQAAIGIGGFIGLVLIGDRSCAGRARVCRSHILHRRRSG